jgi:hypothetical protein
MRSALDQLCDTELILLLDQGETAARRLQERYQVSAMVQRSGGIQMHVISREPPLPGALPIQPDLEEAYPFTIGGKA